MVFGDVLPVDLARVAQRDRVVSNCDLSGAVSPINSPGLMKSKRYQVARELRTVCRIEQVLKQFPWPLPQTAQWLVGAFKKLRSRGRT